MLTPRSEWEDDPRYRRRGTRATFKFGLILIAFYLSTWGFRGDFAAACGVLLLRYALLLIVMTILVLVWKERWLETGGAPVVWNCVTALAAGLHLVALNAEPKLLAVLPCCTLIEALCCQWLETHPIWHELWFAAWWIGLPTVIQVCLFYAIRYGQTL